MQQYISMLCNSSAVSCYSNSLQLSTTASPPSDLVDRDGHRSQAAHAQPANTRRKRIIIFGPCGAGGEGVGQVIRRQTDINLHHPHNCMDSRQCVEASISIHFSHLHSHDSPIVA